MSRAEASAAAGVALGAGTSDTFRKTAQIVAHSGCRYNANRHDVAFDLNTIASSFPIAEYSAKGFALAKAHGGKSVTVDGNPGISYQIGALQDVGFYRGQVSVLVLAANAKPGAALAVAKLIAKRM